MKLKLGIVLLFMCTGAFANDLQYVRVQLEWKYQFEFAGFIAAKELGYYREVGLDVDLVEYEPAVDNILSLIQGDADYVVHNSNLVVHGGHIAPVVVLATYFQRSPLIFVTHPSIRTPGDLVGKRIMGTTDEFRYSSLALLLNHFYVNSTNSDVREHTFSIDDFIQGKVDAMSAFRSNQLYELDRLGVSYNVIDPADYGFVSSAVSVLATQNAVVQNPEQTQRFVEATNRGWQYALDNVDEVINMILERYSQQKSAEALRYEAAVSEQMMQLDLFPLGATSDELGQRIFKQLKRSGLLHADEQYKQYTLDTLLAKLGQEMQLSPSQRQYVLDKGELIACIQGDNLPLEAFQSQAYVGIVAELLQAAFRRDVPVPLRVHPVASGESWQEALSLGRCDFVSMAVANGKDKNFSYSREYLQQPLLLATSIDTLFVSDLHRLSQRTIGTVNDEPILERLRATYPELKFVPQDDSRDALTAVANGELFGYIDESSVIANQIQKTYSDSLKIGATLGQGIGFAMAVAQGNNELLEILDGVAARISSDELAIQRAYNNWVSVRNETAFDYTLFWQIFAGVAVAGAFLFINNLRLRRLSHQLLTMSITDSLTGVGNRARADQLLRSAHRDLKKGAPGCGLILCDIDHFKTINDTHGHQVGDVILKEFAATLLSAMRSDAEICRWGGEEFLILIRETDEHGLQVLADRLRTCIAETTFSAGLKVTASFGFGMQNPNISIDRNITNIDDALYQAKNSGRNCAVAADIH